MSTYSIGVVSISISVQQESRNLRAIILPQPDLRKGLPLTITTFNLLNLYNFNKFFPSMMWLCARLITYRFGNCLIFSIRTITLCDRSNYFIEWRMGHGIESSLSMQVMPLPKNDSRFDDIRWLFCQDCERGCLSQDFVFVFIIFCRF